MYNIIILISYFISLLSFLLLSFCLGEEEEMCQMHTQQSCKNTLATNFPLTKQSASCIAYFKQPQQIDSVGSMPRIRFGTMHEVSNGPPAISYSDGLDSSTIVKEIQGDPPGQKMNVSTIQRGSNSSMVLGSDQSQLLSSSTYTQPSKLSEVL